MKAEDVQTVNLFGMKATIFTVWVMYQSKDKKTVTAILGGNGSVSNWQPAKITKESVDKVIYGNKAHTKVVWKISAPISLPFIDIGFAFFNKHHHVLGFANGTSTYRYFNG